MTLANPTQKLSAAAYLLWENQQTERHMFVQGEVFAMAGASAEHINAVFACTSLLKQHLKHSACQVFFNDMRLAVAEVDANFYPDVVVTCETAVSNTKINSITAPKLIIEVLSPSTASFDRGQKFSYYRSLASLEEYVLVDPDLKTVEVYRKRARDIWEFQPSNVTQPAVQLASVDWHGSIEQLLI
jgi:Uma2 family endonuclease